MSEQFDHDAGLGLPDINELAAVGVAATTAAGPVNAVAESCEGCGKPATKKDADGVRLCDGCFEELKAEAKAEPPAVATPASPEDPCVLRAHEIRARLTEIGDPFAERQRLAGVRAGLLEERRKKDEALRLKIGEADNALAVEQERAQWVAQEKHDLEKELAKLLKRAD